MNIEKLAKRLKEFTLDEIEMIAEVNCETALNRLLKANKIEFHSIGNDCQSSTIKAEANGHFAHFGQASMAKEGNNGIYKYLEQKQNLDFGVFVKSPTKTKILGFEIAVSKFLEDYAKKNCKKSTFDNYTTIFKMNILPFFKGRKLNSIDNSDVLAFYKHCEERNFSSRRLKNILALLNQLIKYFQNQGLIDRKCVFQVKRLTDKTKFALDKIIFDKERI